MFDGILQDLRLALRSLRRAPSWAATVVLTLALGIGANVAIFSVADATLFRPLPFPNANELVSSWGASAADYLAVRERIPSFKAAAAYSEADMNVADDAGAARAAGAEVSANFFPLLGVHPAVGHLFAADADEPGTAREVMLTDALWRARYHADRAIVGRTLTIEGISRTVAGVMPASVTFPNTAVQLWIPAAYGRGNAGVLWGLWKYHVIARMRPDALPEKAAAELRALAQLLRHENPMWDPGKSFGADASVVPLQKKVAGPARLMLVALMGVVGFLFLVTCANVTNLVLARAAAREREFTIRASLGSGSARVVRQVLSETLVLASFGAAGAVALTWVGVRLLGGALPAELMQLATVRVSGRVLGFAALLSVVATLLCGFVPALRAARARPMRELGSRGASQSAGRKRLSSGLVIAELALAATLVLGAGLLLRSFDALRRVDPGFASAQLLTARVTLAPGSYAAVSSRLAFFGALNDRLTGAPGLKSVALVNSPPLRGAVYGSALRVEGEFEDMRHALPTIDHAQVITPSYFATMGIRLVRGRSFTVDDRSDGPPVAVVSESVARKFWRNDADAIGKRIGRPYASPWITVVGVVADVKQDSLSGNDESTWYTPLSQAGPTDMTVVARTSSDPAALAATVREAVAALDRSVPVSDVRTMGDVVSASVARARFMTLLVWAFAALALTLAAVGIYGVVATLVSQRRRELAIRMALGATPLGVLGLVLRHGALLAALGLAGGLAMALGLTRFIAGFLFGVGATDPVTFVSVPLILLAVTTLATLVPAIRAMRSDPGLAMRDE